jgi:hypothetical protein
MVTTPQGQDLSVVLNAIRSTSSSAYQSTVPAANANNIKDVGAAVLAAPTAIRNEFMSNLYNKVGLTLIDTPVIENEFAFLKKGTLEYGQTIEDLYVGIAQADKYSTGMKDGDTVPDQFAIKKAAHFSAFYSTILSRQYWVTRHLTDLKKAFHSGGGVEQFLAALMNHLVSGENYDDMRASIALIARQVEAAQTAPNFKGNVHLVSGYNAAFGKSVTADNCFQDQGFLKYFANQLKKYSKRLRHLRTDLNIAGVQQTLPQNKQRIMMLEDITVDFETELLSWAYNKGGLEIGAVDEIDSWYSIGADFANPPTVQAEDINVKALFTNAAGGSTQCAAVIYDPDMVKIYNKERIASDSANARGNYYNYFMSVEDILACSPYKNFVCFMLD